MPRQSSAGARALPRTPVRPTEPGRPAEIDPGRLDGVARRDGHGPAAPPPGVLVPRQAGFAGMPAPERADGSPPAVPPGARPLDPPADLECAVESLLFVAQEPVEPEAMARVLSISVAQVERAIDALAERRSTSGIRVQRGDGRVQLISAPELGPYVERFLGAASEQRLSAAALETLAIVAYRQPVTRGVLESIRGVNCERALANLRARDLVQELGRAETVGHPVLFGTTMRFLEYFGLQHPGELPPLPDAG